MIVGSVLRLSDSEVKRLDWNKTKTILIIVFAVLNVFLYSLYLNRYTEAQNVQVVEETSIEESFQLDNIQYDALPTEYEEASYVLAEILEFPEDELEGLNKQTFTEGTENQLVSNLEEPYAQLKNKGEYDFTPFLDEYVLNGDEYVLWKIDEDLREASFFQTVEEKPIYFNKNAMLTIYWDEEDEITHYEQSLFSKFESYNKKKDLLPPIQALNTLYSRGYLKQDSKVASMQLGYSTLIQLTETQVFAPTWHVHVELQDEEEDYFINAIDGKIIEFQSELEQAENG